MVASGLLLQGGHRLLRPILRGRTYEAMISTPCPAGKLVGQVTGAESADIVELKVTQPEGYQYIFTEDDLVTSEVEALGDYYMVNFRPFIRMGPIPFQ